MVRIGLILLLAFGGYAAGGCTTSEPTWDDKQSLTTVTETSPSGREFVGEPIAASALVFAPPVTMGSPALDLDRSIRQPSAFVGYDEGTVEQYRITVDDQQIFGNGWGAGCFHNGCPGWYGSGWGSRYERRVESERVGAIRR